MRKILCALLLVTAGFSAPPAYRVRIHIQAPPELNADASRLREALLRGLYSDSIIVPGPDSLLPSFKPGKPDTAAYHHWIPVMMLAAELSDSAGIVVARLRLMNILTQPVAPPETIRVSPTLLDSVGVERGRAYARRLAGLRRATPP